MEAQCIEKWNATDNLYSRLFMPIQRVGGREEWKAIEKIRCVTWYQYVWTNASRLSYYLWIEIDKSLASSIMDQRTVSRNLTCNATVANEFSKGACNETTNQCQHFIDSTQPKQVQYLNICNIILIYIQAKQWSLPFFKIEHA